MRLAAWTFALVACSTALPAFACAGAVSVDVSFARGESLLSPAERLKLESGVRKARAAGAGELKAALAIYAQDAETSTKAELNRLIERRVVALRESFALLGLDAAAVMAVRGDPASLQAPIGNGGFAEIEIAFGC